MRDTLTFSAIRARQSPTHTVLSFAARASDLRRFATIDRVSRDTNGELSGFQRPQIANHIREIKDYLEQEGSILPNPIVVAFTSGTSVQDADGDRCSLEIDVTDGAPGLVMDGQQRLSALTQMDGKEFEVLVSAVICADEAELRRQFVLVNNTLLTKIAQASRGKRELQGPKPTPIRANRVGEVLRKMFNLAVWDSQFWIPGDVSIEDVQSEFARLGYYELAINGEWGPGSRRAVRQYQRTLGEQETGSLVDGLGLFSRMQAARSLDCLLAVECSTVRLHETIERFGVELAMVPKGEYDVVETPNSLRIWFQIGAAGRTGWVPSRTTAHGSDCFG